MTVIFLGIIINLKINSYHVLSRALSDMICRVFYNMNDNLNN